MDFKGAILEKEVQDRDHHKDPNEMRHLLDIYYVSNFGPRKNGYVVCEYSFCTSLLLIRRANSLKKTLILGKIECKR